ncbi:MAG TPA: hypothetical protein VFV49_08245 [Thermoanaerobaculia bacterium]|nr:hypothetical protein [Thermoanaerobaculia bacterium]
MKQLLASAACIALIACGSSGGSGGAAVPTAAAIGTVEPETSLVQLVGPEELNWEAGNIELKYALRINNRAAEPITLRQIQIQTVGVEGPYYVLQSSYFFREPVTAGGERAVEFFAKGYSSGNRYSIAAQSPVSVRVIAYFEAPKGNFRQTFITNLGQSFKSQ